MTEKRLFRVEWSGECVVFAETPHEALRIARREVDRDSSACALEACVVGEISAEKPHIPAGWRDSPPFGTDGMRTVAQILEANING